MKLFARSSVLILFQNIERVAVMVLHADSPQNGSHGPRSTPLLAYHFADIAGCNSQSQNGALLAFYSFNNDCTGFIHQGAGNFGYQLLHVIRAFFVGHFLAPLEVVGVTLSGSRHTISNFARKTEEFSTLASRLARNYNRGRSCIKSKA